MDATVARTDHSVERWPNRTLLVLVACRVGAISGARRRLVVGVVDFDEDLVEVSVGETRLHVDAFLLLVLVLLVWLVRLLSWMRCGSVLSMLWVMLFVVSLCLG